MIEVCVHLIKQYSSPATKTPPNSLSNVSRGYSWWQHYQAMTSPVPFSTGASPVASGSSRNLHEFEAAEMEMRDRMIHAIQYLRQSPDDSLMYRDTGRAQLLRLQEDRFARANKHKDNPAG